MAIFLAAFLISSHSHSYSRILLLWKCFSKFVFILISILLIDVAIVIVVGAYLLHVQRAVAELWKIACLANNNNTAEGATRWGRKSTVPLSPVKLSTDSFRGPLIDTVALSPSPAECGVCWLWTRVQRWRWSSQGSNNTINEANANSLCDPRRKCSDSCLIWQAFPKREKETERERWQRTCHYVIRIRLTDSWVN